MDAPSQVRVKLCVIGLALLPVFVSLGGATLRAEAPEPSTPCVDPSRLSRSVVSIAWYFDKARPSASPGKEVVGERATA